MSIRMLRPKGPATKADANTRLTMVMTLIKMFIDGPEVSLNGSPTVLRPLRPVPIATFATMVAGLDVLLGVVPGATGVGHEDGEAEPTDQGAGQDRRGR